MAATIQDVSCTGSAFTEISRVILGNLASMKIQLKSDGPVIVAIGGRAPGDTSTEGWLLTRENPVLEIPNVDDVDAVFLRSSRDAENTLAVIESLAGLDDGGGGPLG